MIWENPFGNKKIPTVEELWKNEKKQYRIWIFTYPVLLFLLVALLGVQLFLNFDTKSLARVFSILSILFTGATLSFYLVSLFISYREKDFASIGNRSFLVTFVAFMSASLSIIISTVSMVSDLKPENENFVAILVIQIILSGLVFILIPYFYSRVLKIKSIFRLSRSIIVFEEQISELKKDPQAFSKFMNIFDLSEENIKNINININNGSSTNDNTNSEEQTEKKPTSKSEKIKKALEKLALSNLHEIAQKLEISGYQDLKKPELIDLLTRILAEQENKK
ncbi:50S ribosomal protein L20/uncharacterised domain fusion protein [Mesomycoplasma dispar]|uniref:50S ribosomal protein L20/uncharacterized domain fusion protein n=1 Tax=Mesomycoplasma dispar TaxID=86660 RepID=A0AAJ5NQN7_9BACT|nr:Rho termination factor N-terminal domain-containing protein [Mesomycoplasma dispar]AJR12162.1 hypothetical protein MDIS_01725 [Mesomycoplasma dispar]ATP60053.1 hypothetical protein CSW10_01630 [Mesomycoplasma dispar]VEU61692.1 50S ribosomal protein L20/uncharacterised domain fusion protein [Mesomycoplasma dispar]